MKSEITIKIRTNLKPRFKMLDASLHDELLNWVETAILENEDIDADVIESLSERDSGEILEDKDGCTPAYFNQLGKVDIEITSIGVDE